MTYGELKHRVLQLIFSDSQAGAKVPPTYNNQADYIDAIPGQLNSAQTYIYQYKPFQACVKVTDLVKEELIERGTDKYTLPDDCMQMIAGLIIPGWSPAWNNAERFMKYRIIAGNTLLLPHGAAERYNLLLEYRKRATPVPENVPDSFVLKNTDEVNEVIPIYIAAMLLAYDDAYRSAFLKNEFEDRLGRLQPNPMYIENTEVRDVYGPSQFLWR